MCVCVSVGVGVGGCVFWGVRVGRGVGRRVEWKWPCGVVLRPINPLALMPPIQILQCYLISQ